MVTKLPSICWPRNIIHYLCCLWNFIFLKSVRHIKSYGHLNTGFKCMILKTLNSNFLDCEDTLRAKRFSTADKMLVEIKSKFNAEIFELKISLRAENGKRSSGKRP